jgi:hypothetical protein
MRDHLIKQLRKHSSVKGKQKTWVSELSEDQLYGLFLRIRNQESAKSIAAYVQKAWGVNPKSTTHSISQGILKFKKRIAHLILTPPPDDEQTPTNFDYDPMERLGSLEEMEQIAQLQRNRIQRMMLEEEELGIKHSNLSRDLQSLATLSKVIMAQKQFEILHGSNDPIIRRGLQRKQRDMAKSWDRIMERVIPTQEDKDKMVAACDRFIELLDEKSVAIDVDTMTFK